MTAPRPHPLIAILGPTASGKSHLAMEIAQRLAGEILCLDSMTVYRGMDIGTAKPTPAERQRVRHHLLDVVDPNEQFTVARFVELADGVIADASARGVPLIATGGTPLYYKALFEGLFEGPSADPALRERLGRESNEVLHARLQQVDPAAAARIHLNDTRRLIRALEVHELTGQPISSLQQEWSSGTLRHPARFVGLLWEKDALNRRINERVRQMMQAGWLEEVRGLLARYGTLSRTALEATGYGELVAHLRSQPPLPSLPLNDAIEQTKIATRQLARKQMKWFRRFGQVRWLTGDQPIEALAEQTLANWS